MILLNDVFKGEVTLDPKYIANMKPSNPNSHPGQQGAMTWINYIEP